MSDDGGLVVDYRCVLAHTPEVFDDSDPVELVGIRSASLRRLCKLEQVRYCRPSVLCFVSLLHMNCLLLLLLFFLITQHSSSNTLECILALEGWR